MALEFKKGQKLCIQTESERLRRQAAEKGDAIEIIVSLKDTNSSDGKLTSAE